MIEHLAFHLDGQEYGCTLDLRSGGVRLTFTTVYGHTVPLSKVRAVVSSFVKQCARQVADRLDEGRSLLFAMALYENGIGSDQIRGAGLEEVADAVARREERDNPGLALKRRYSVMPAAAHSPLNCVVLRNWFVSPARTNAIHPASVFLVGSDPFEQAEFHGFLSSRGVRVESSRSVCGAMILGRNNWLEDDVDAAINRHTNKSLRIYSQEMFICLLGSGRDPLGAGGEACTAFQAGHRGLEFVARGWPGWVDLHVRTDRGGGLRTEVDEPDRSLQADVSPLRALGYAVGTRGLSVERRREILGQAFLGDLPTVESIDYMQKWGTRRSPERLRRLAEHLASLCRQGKIHRGRTQAVADWEDDLEWLRRTFYQGHMRFSWPYTHSKP